MKPELMLCGLSAHLGRNSAHSSFHSDMSQNPNPTIVVARGCDGFVALSKSAEHTKRGGSIPYVTNINVELFANNCSRL
jgi:hypothetical protein